MRLTSSRDQIRENVLLKQYYCDVDIGHLISFNEELAHRLSTEPAEIIPLVGANLSSISILLINHDR
jgi:DNA replication licensing factor MCM5